MATSRCALTVKNHVKTINAEAWAFSIPTENFHFVQASVTERLALPASNVAVGSVFNLDSLFFKYFM